MKKQNHSTGPAKKPAHCPMGLSKLELAAQPKTVQSTGLTPVAKAAKAHRNTISSTNKRTDHGNCPDSGNDYDEFDDLKCADHQGYARGGKRKGHTSRADLADVDGELDLDQPCAGSDSSDDGEGFDSIPAWDVTGHSEAHLKHVASCVCIDTVGLEFADISPKIGKLAKTFSQTDDDGQAMAGSGWSKASLQSPTGKRSLVVGYERKTKKLSIEGSNAVHRQGHNVVASGDMTATAYSMARAVKVARAFPWSDRIGFELTHGHGVEVTRIDVFLLLKVPEGVTKAQFINALAIAGIRAGLDTALYVNESVYFDQSSQLAAAKIYDKEADLHRARKGGLPNLPGVEHLKELNERTVRLEAVFRAKRLVQIAKIHGKRPHPALFSKELLAQMVLTLLKKYQVHGNVFRRLERQDLLAIPLPFRSTVAHWQNCENLLDMVKSVRVLKLQMAYLKLHHNINVDAPAPGEFHEAMSLMDILSPENFIPVPEVIRSNPELFYQLNLSNERRNLRSRAGSGIGGALISPNRPPDEIIFIDGEPHVI